VGNLTRQGKPAELNGCNPLISKARPPEKALYETILRPFLVREKPLLPKQRYRASLPDFFAIKALHLNQVRIHPFRANLAALGAIPDNRQTFATKYLHPPAIIQNPASIFYAGYGGGPEIIDIIPIGGEGIRDKYCGEDIDDDADRCCIYAALRGIGLSQ
jgi:hypothetical protein